LSERACRRDGDAGPSPEMSALSTYMSEAANRPLLLESKYDRQFKAVFDTIRELMAHSTPQTRRPIGFTSWTDEE